MGKYKNKVRDVKIKEVEKMLGCMDIEKGYTSYICEACGEIIYISHTKKHNKVISMETELNTDILIAGYEKPLEDSLFIANLLDNLSEIQKQIIKKIFIQDVSEITISKQLNISRQAVNKTKNRALKTMRANYFENYLI